MAARRRERDETRVFKKMGEAMQWHRSNRSHSDRKYADVASYIPKHKEFLAGKDKEKAWQTPFTPGAGHVSTGGAEGITKK